MSRIQALADAYRQGHRLVSDEVSARLSTIQTQDPTIKAFLSVQSDLAMAQANDLDHRFQKGDPMPLLAGIPIGIKDNIHINGRPTTCASKMLATYTAPYDASVSRHLLSQDAILIGKTNMDEFAMGSSTEHSAFQTTRNPRDVTRVPGGSSGGSAAAVAADMVVAALGSDTGGSIRQPAAFCGIVGLKPTYGRVSRYGLVAFASSLDQIGPLTHTVEDAAILLDAISGFDPLDSTASTHPPTTCYHHLRPDIQGMSIGVPHELLGEAIDPAVKASVITALDQLAAHGARWESFSMPVLNAAVSTYYIIAPAEASSNLARFDGVRYGYRHPNGRTVKDMITNSRGHGLGDEVKRRIIIGTYVLSSGYYDAYYNQAQQVRRAITQSFHTAFQRYDLIVTPTAPSTAFELGAHHRDPLGMYLADIATIPVNMAGLPAISIPCNPDPSGLPIGLQLIAPAFEEQRLLNAALLHQTLSMATHTPKETL
ncbi:Asp-tRNA(Asn)/Glu-tRNA(Gln) amidotransferase subunit GatA [bacterium]|nr:Asp-tRNA(Asn)/Glu-tRNA(Gln) amidotransferase subunit GatA [bacterium]